MSTPILQPVTIIKEDAEVFLAFKRHREKFLVLMAAGVFDLDHGQININIHNGQVQTVHVDRMTYKKDRHKDGPEA